MPPAPPRGVATTVLLLLLLLASVSVAGNAGGYPERFVDQERGERGLAAAAAAAFCVRVLS